MATFHLNLLPNELAHKFLMGNFVLVGCLISRRKLSSSWLGSFAHFMQISALVKFAQMFQNNLTSKTHMITALNESVDQQVENIGEMSVKKWLAVLLPIPQFLSLKWIYPNIKWTHTLTYAHVGKQTPVNLKMDVYKHENTPSNAPIFLYIHGGGWVLGHRWFCPMPLIHQVASTGWIVCSIDYRLSPAVAFPNQLIDCKRAVAYLRKNATKVLNGNPNFIVCGGESAGAHLASLIAVSSYDTSLQPGFEEVDTSVNGCIDTYGIHDITDRNGNWFYRAEKGFLNYMEVVIFQRKMKNHRQVFENASPTCRLTDKVHKKIPPFLIVHGKHDSLVPVEDARDFYSQLKKYRQENQDEYNCKDVFIEIPETHHAFNFLLSTRTLAFGDAVVEFLNRLKCSYGKECNNGANVVVKSKL